MFTDVKFYEAASPQVVPRGAVFFMAFSSVQFLFVFLPLSLAVYWRCALRLRNAVLAAFSLLFFMWAGLKGAAILVLLAGINWLAGFAGEAGPQKAAADFVDLAGSGGAGRL